MVTAALFLFLTVAPDQPVEAPPQVSPGATRFDALPPQPQVSDDARVQRFLGAFAGGVVGLAAGLSLMPLGDASAFCFPAGSCVSAVHGMFGAFAPLLSLTGAFLGYQLMGGSGSLLTTAVAMAPAVLIALTLLSIAAEAGASTALEFAPYMVGAGVFLAAGAALSLDLRAQQLNSLGGASSWGGASAGRVALTSLVSLLTVGSSVALTALTAALCRSAECVALPVTVGAVLSLAAAASVFGVHRALNGRGNFAAVLLGMGTALAVSGAATGLFITAQGGFGGAFSPVRSTSATVLLLELAFISGIFFPMLALEWSHSANVKSALPSFTMGAAPLREGGMVSAALRF